MSNVIVRDLKYLNEDALENIFAYCLRIEKDKLSDSKQSVIWGGNGLLLNTPQSAINSFIAITSNYNKNLGNLLHHVIINLKCDKKISDLISIAIEIGEKIGFDFFKKGFQSAYFIHIKNGYVHIHLIVNSISYMTGNRINSSGWLGNNIISYLFLNYPHLKWEYNVIYNNERYY